MNAFKSMTMDNWCNLFMLMVLLSLIMWLYLEYRKMCIEGDEKGKKVFKWMIRCGIILYLFSIVYNALCTVGVIDPYWYTYTPIWGWWDC